MKYLTIGIALATLAGCATQDEPLTALDRARVECRDTDRDRFLQRRDPLEQAVVDRCVSEARERIEAEQQALDEALEATIEAGKQQNEDKTQEEEQ